jgi:hypothetical protein
MRLKRTFLLLLTSSPLAFGDVSFTSPVAGGSVPGGKVLKVTWVDSGVAPPLNQLSSYKLFLYTGSNEAPVSTVSLKRPGSQA